MDDCADACISATGRCYTWIEVGSASCLSCEQPVLLCKQHKCIYMYIYVYIYVYIWHIQTHTVAERSNFHWPYIYVVAASASIAASSSQWFHLNWPPVCWCTFLDEWSTGESPLMSLTQRTNRLASLSHHEKPTQQHSSRWTMQLFVGMPTKPSTNNELKTCSLAIICVHPFSLFAQDYHRHEVLACHHYYQHIPFVIGIAISTLFKFN
jgi:hypothetical protein